MSCLGPLAPVSGSDAARRRRAQLRTQLPPHDVAPAARAHATDQEKTEHTVCIFLYTPQHYLPLHWLYYFKIKKKTAV